MKASWTQVTPSEYPWEREALAFLQARLPDFEPYRAWANFEFITDGTVSEVDVLVIARKAIFLIEIKSWPGRLEGDAGTWMWTPPGERPRPRDNPYLLANRKAKRLKSLLARQKAMRGRRMPFIAPLVFLSDPDLQIALDPDARHGVCVRDDRAPLSSAGLQGVVQTVTTATQEELQRLKDGRIDRPAAKALAQAIDQAGIRPAQRQRQVGDLQLGDLLDEGAGYQDYIGVHPRFPDVQHRVRIYGSADLAATEQRTQLGRAARREYELLHGVSHPGIVRALAFHEHELGPAIVFERSPREERLDHYLARCRADLNLYDRLALMRDLVEAVAYAHSRRLYHRALSPRSVLVTNEPDLPARLRIVNWQTGAIAETTTVARTLGGTVHPEALVDDETTPYLAPETITQPDADPELLDVFSLGAIAYFIFGGQAPAANLAGLVARLQRDGALEISAVLDGAGSSLEYLIREATYGDSSQRLQSVSDVLAGIDAVVEESTAPTIDGDDADPAEARKGDRLGPLTVEHRLGRGSTALALLVRDADGQQRVLKVANDPERNERVREEGEVLAKLRHPAIVAVHGDPLELSGRTGILLTYASGGTLAHLLRHDGRVSLENLQVWGDDLLSALAHLEQEGVAHRDIKPENLGIAPVGARKKRHLLLLDFSLARASIDQLGAGTPPYLDPFLGTGKRRQWDPAADRFSAAMVLHEMAAGVLPYWKAPRVDPRMVEDEVTIDADLLPRAVAAPLAALLRRALARDATARFGTAEEFLDAWRALFVNAETRHETADPEVDQERLLAGATNETPVSALGFGTRAADALDRLGVLTVADLVRLDPKRINNLRGASLVTRGELKEVRNLLRDRLGTAARPELDETALEDVQALDRLVAQLLPRRTTRTTAKIEGLAKLLGLELLPEPPVAPWPTQTEVAAALHVTRARVQQIATDGRERWKRLPSVTRLRGEVVAAIEALGGVATAEEVERVIAAERGAGDAAGVETLARAAVRAAVETELSREEPRLGQRRTGSRILLAVGDDERDRQRALDATVQLGKAADELAAEDTLLPSAEVVERLRARSTVPRLRALAPERLVALAAGASQQAAASALLELHPRGMDGQRALRLGAGALRGATELTVDDVRRRIAARFPAAQPLPGRPQLDGLLREAGIELRWDVDRYRARPRTPVEGLTSLVSSSATRLPTAHTAIAIRRDSDPDVVRARETEQRLERAARDGGLLVLLAPPADIVHAGRDLERFPVISLDADRLMLDALRTHAEARGAAWHVVLAADAAAPGERDWARLQTLVSAAVASIEQRLATEEGTVLLRNLGLLVRYGQLSMVERLRDRILAGGPLKGLWLLIPADRQSERPMLDGIPIPVLTANEALRLPGPWLRNVHRAQLQAA
jgi:serine/threonine protein kinase